jgi:hypothetical protein
MGAVQVVALWGALGVWDLAQCLHFGVVFKFLHRTKSEQMHEQTHVLKWFCQVVNLVEWIDNTCCLECNCELTQHHFNVLLDSLRVHWSIKNSGGLSIFRLFWVQVDLVRIFANFLQIIKDSLIQIGEARLILTAFNFGHKVNLLYNHSSQNLELTNRK